MPQLDDLQPDRLAEIRRWLQEHPFNRWIGFEFEHLGPDLTVVSFIVREHHRYISGLLHGGIHATLLDTVMGLAARLAVSQREAVRTTMLSVEYVAPSRADVVAAQARVVTLEPDTLRAAGEVLEGRSTVSRGSATFTRLPRKSYR